MAPTAILRPVFVQVGLAHFLGIRLGLARRSAVSRGHVRLDDIALGRKPWPDRIEQLGNPFRNQFELRISFFVLVAFAMITKIADLAFVVLEWLFVESRIAHAVIHTTSNHVPTRFRVFVAGTIVLLVMWVMLAVRVLLGAA